MSNEDLPSINDIVEESNLPSYKDFIEVKEEELLSVEDYISESVEEESLIEEEDIETVLSETAPEWSELVRLVNDVRKDIPEIPEIKYYDEQLKELSDKLSQIQDLNEDKLTEIESKIPELPEIKYYDADIQFIYDKIGRIKEEINSLPEVKYYESDLNSLKSRIEEVNQNIPTFPDWVQEVQEVPDFSWIGKTFSIIDDDFNKVQGHLDLIREKIDYQVSELNETIGNKEFELNIDIKNVDNSINDTNIYLNETKDKIYKELKDSSIRIWEHHKEFKDDDRKLKKSIVSEQNKLKQSLQEQIKEINSQSVKADEALLKFFNDLNEEVKSLPKVKYYDTEVSDIVEDIDSLRVNIEDIKDIVSLIKKDQKQLEENYLLNEPPDKEQSVGSGVDPLTPMDQKFATLDDLSNHYRVFINRIQTQLSTMGGGGETKLQYLDDIVGVATNLNAYDGMVLQVDTSGPAGKKFKFAGSVGAGGTWAYNNIGVHTTKNVGVGTTARTDFALYVGGDQYVDGNVTVGGTITYEDVKNVDSIGIVTARSGINVLAGGISAVGVVTATKLHVGVDTGFFNENLVVNGDARVTGILTIGTASITLDPLNKKIEGIDEIIIGTANTVRIHQDSSGEIKFSDRTGRESSVGIGTSVSINTTGIITAATLKASTAFYPPIYTTTQRDAGTFGEGAMIFNTTSKKMEFYNGTSWQSLPGMSLGLTVALDG